MENLKLEHLIFHWKLTQTEDKQGVLIIIDEIHNLKNLPQTASVFRNIVTTLDVEGFGKVSFLLIGYEEDVNKFFSKDISARRTFDLYHLDTMPDDDAIEVITKGLTAVGIKWEAAFLEKNISVSGGYPYFIQVLGKHVVEADKDNNIDNDDWKNAIINSALELQTKNFSQFYSFDRQPSEQDIILRTLAKENKPLTRQELLDKTGFKNIYQSLGRLKTKGAIKENVNKEFYLHSQLFRVSILLDIAIQERKLEQSASYLHENKTLQGK